MSEQETGEPLAVLTPRLVFNKEPEFDDDDIPAFLRKDHKDPKNKPIVIQEPETPATVELPEEASEVMEPDNEAAPELVEPVLAEETAQVETKEDVVEMTEVSAEEGTDNGSNLDEMSVDELKRQQEEIDRKIREKQQAEKAAVIAQIVEVVNNFNIPIDELVEALGGLKVKRKGVKAVQKYQDPATGQTWSGRGKEPAWIKGKDRKPFLIK